jgi:FlaA1/EpsC-like NDP-sugar epimerase
MQKPREPGRIPKPRQTWSSILMNLIPDGWAGPGQVVLDVLGWATAIVAIAQLTGRIPSRGGFGRLAVLIAVTVIVLVLTGLIMGLYRQRWRFGSLDEIGAVVRTAFAAGIALTVASELAQPHVLPLSVAVCGGFVGLVAMFGIRYLWRLAFEAGHGPDEGSAARTIVFGAGEAGSEIVRGMKRNPRSPYLPVAFLDDDAAKQRHEVSHVRVMGTRADLIRVAAEMKASTLLIAMPSASAELLAYLNTAANSTGLDVKILPPIHELFEGQVRESDIRDITETDLLGRRQIETDVDAIAGYLRGKRVLVTGAGGSIGSELCRQISRFEPEMLYMLDRDESALHSVQMSIDGSALLDTPNVLLADIRDAATIRSLFAEVRPHVVFHAAALKHLPLLESFPSEAVKSNVWGTLNVLEASEEAGVDLFVNISTDKAANPSSVLGYSKRVAERITASFASTADHGTYVSVRFGNVLGSRGSMLPAFKAMIAAGGPLTVTEPNVTRFFMTIPESVQLVIQAGAIGRPGEVLVLDMGDPIRIDDVARMMIRESGKPIEIVYTGLRQGEKLHEELFGDDESDVRPVHPLISHVAVPTIDLQDIIEIDADAELEKVVLMLRALTTCAVSEPSSAQPETDIRPRLAEAS